MEISEIFDAIQGEGRYAGEPCVFVRLQGCNLKCWFCDTSYARSKTKGEKKTVEELYEVLKKKPQRIVVFTGGEPLLQAEELMKLMLLLKHRKKLHLESNGTLTESKEQKACYFLADYIAISPKNLKSAILWTNGTMKLPALTEIDIKVVTDLDRINQDMLDYASILMPITSRDVKKDRDIRRAVWTECIKRNLRYSPRMHFEVWGKKRRA